MDKIWTKVTRPNFNEIETFRAFSEFPQPGVRGQRWTAPYQRWPKRKVVQAERSGGAGWSGAERGWGEKIRRSSSSLRKNWRMTSADGWWMTDASSCFGRGLQFFLPAKKESDYSDWWSVIERTIFQWWPRIGLLHLMISFLSFLAIASTTSASSWRASGPTIWTFVNVQNTDDVLNLPPLFGSSTFFLEPPTFPASWMKNSGAEQGVICPKTTSKVASLILCLAKSFVSVSSVGTPFTKVQKWSIFLPTEDKTASFTQKQSR